jgi:hypothetical protein
LSDLRNATATQQAIFADDHQIAAQVDKGCRVAE